MHPYVEIYTDRKKYTLLSRVIAAMKVLVEVQLLPMESKIRAKLFYCSSQTETKKTQILSGFHLTFPNYKPYASTQLSNWYQKGSNTGRTDYGFESRNLLVRCELGVHNPAR